MNKKEQLAAVEAVIFASGEPISLDRLAAAVDLPEEALPPLLEMLEQRLDAPESGIRLVRLEDSYQLCTKASQSAFVRRAFEIRRNTPLSQAALEVLAVVAYNQPVTRAFVEQVRGVDCSGVVGSLCEKGLLEEKGRLDLPGRPLLYGTTATFLRCFGLSSIEELPPLPAQEEGTPHENPIRQMVIDPDNAASVPAESAEATEATETAEAAEAAGSPLPDMTGDGADRSIQGENVSLDAAKS